MAYLIKKIDNIDSIMVEAVYNIYCKCKYISSDFTRKYVKTEIDNILKNGIGFELFENNNPIGYISAYKINCLFYKEKGYYTPEIGLFYNGNIKILNILLKTLYEEMRKENFSHHAISRIVPINEQQWYDMGYGLRTIDVARTVKTGETDIELKRISVEDIDEFYPFYKEHEQYMKRSPIFLETDDSREACINVINDKKNELYFLKIGDINIGFTTLNKIDASGSELFKDNQTLAIKSTHILTIYQHQGYGIKAIQAIMNLAYNLGFKKISTDFESFNILANNFWPKSLNTVAKSFVRYIGKNI